MNSSIQSKLEAEWYKKHNCTHAHCINHCEKPQPFLAEDGKMYCGRCSVYFGKLTEVIPCTPEICD